MTTTYEVYQPSTSGPERLHSGVIISRHRTPEAAGRRIFAATARLRRQPGMRQSWLDWSVRAVVGGERRVLTTAELNRALRAPEKA